MGAPTFLSERVTLVIVGLFAVRMWKNSQNYCEMFIVYALFAHVTADLRVAGRRPLFNPLNAELNPICHLLALLGAHHIFHVSRLRVKMVRFPSRRLTQTLQTCLP